MSKSKIRLLIKQYKAGQFKNMTLRQSYYLSLIIAKELTVKEAEALS